MVIPLMRTAVLAAAQAQAERQVGVPPMVAAQEAEAPLASLDQMAALLPTEAEAEAEAVETATTSAAARAAAMLG
jgi:hypothetical protein